MSKAETNLELFAPETILNTDEEGAVDVNPKRRTSEPEDELISLETLRESPVQWPERFPGMDEFLTASDTPIHTPNVEYSNNLTASDMAKINKLSSMTPEQLIEKIKSMQDEIYQLGLREAKEMTRGKLLGIFDRDRLTKRK